MFKETSQRLEEEIKNLLDHTKWGEGCKGRIHSGVINIIRKWADEEDEKLKQIHAGSMEIARPNNASDKKSFSIMTPDMSAKGDDVLQQIPADPVNRVAKKFGIKKK